MTTCGCLDWIRLESRLQLVLDDSDFAAATMYSKAALLTALVSARARLCIANAHSRRTVHARAQQSDHASWCRADIPSIISEHVRSSPAKWILKFVNSPACGDHIYVTWKQLFEAAGGYAELFSRHGLAPGQVVTLLLPQGLPLVAAVVGAILGRYIPSVCACPSEKLSRDAFAGWFGATVAKSDTKLILCGLDHQELIRTLVAGRGLPIVVTADRPARAPVRPPDVGLPQPHAAAILQHSSGTTGMKKAVQLPHAAILSQTWQLGRALRLSDDDVIVSWLPLYHDMGFVACLLFPLIHSVPTVLMSPFDWARAPDLLLREVEAERGTLCWLPNFAFLHCANAVRRDGRRTYDASSLRAVISCSEPVTAAARDTFYHQFAASGLRYSALSSSYAMAEATFAITQAPLGRASRTIRVDRRLFESAGRVDILGSVDLQRPALTLVSSGRALSHTTIEIVDSGGVGLPDGHVGEIRVRTPSLMSGYYGDSGESTQHIRDGWYYTGDLGCIVDAELYVTGRRKDMVILSGTNVYPHYVEEIVSSLAGIRPGRVVAFGMFDRSAGTERLVVMAEPRDWMKDPDLNSDRLQLAIAERILAVFGVAVHDVVLVESGLLKKSTSGKISRNQNKRLYAELHGVTAPAAMCRDDHEPVRN